MQSYSIGGNNVFFHEIKRYLQEIEIELSHRFCDEQTDNSPLIDDFYNKQIIYDHKSHIVSICSITFTNMMIELWPGEHLTLTKSFSKEFDRAASLSQSVEKEVLGGCPDGAESYHKASEGKNNTSFWM